MEREREARGVYVTLTPTNSQPKVPGTGIKQGGTRARRLGMFPQTSFSSIPSS